jgi:predicted RNA-binding protein with PIN domain
MLQQSDEQKLHEGRETDTRGHLLTRTKPIYHLVREFGHFDDSPYSKRQRPSSRVGTSSRANRSEIHGKGAYRSSTPALADVQNTSVQVADDLRQQQAIFEEMQGKPLSAADVFKRLPRVNYPPRRNIKPKLPPITGQKEREALEKEYKILQKLLQARKGYSSQDRMKKRHNKKLFTLFEDPNRTKGPSLQSKRYSKLIKSEFDTKFKEVRTLIKEVNVSHGTDSPVDYGSCSS